MRHGYTQPLYILPFDHRASFTKGLFGIENRELAPSDVIRVQEAKHIIYEAFQKAIENGIPKESGAILIDEQFGDKILQDSRSKGYITMLSAEKSGKDIFEFEYGDAFAEHIEKYKPTFVKALIRYNTEGDKQSNKIQQERLKLLSDYCHEHNYKFLLEPLVPATEAQFQHVNRDTRLYDTLLRPNLTVVMIKELQTTGVEVDVWKLEGFEEKEAYENVSQQARFGGRENVGVVILGRNAEDSQVEQWLEAGKGVDGVIGFAVGRTVFWNALVKWRDDIISKDEALQEISTKYRHFYDVFTT